MEIIPPIIVKNLDKNPDEVYGGRWINADHLINWLDENINDLNVAQKARFTEEREGMISIMKYIKKQIMR